MAPTETRKPMRTLCQNEKNRMPLTHRNLAALSVVAIVRKTHELV